MDNMKITILKWIINQYPGTFIWYPNYPDGILIGKGNRMSIAYTTRTNIISIINHTSLHGVQHGLAKQNPCIEISIEDPEFFEKTKQSINNWLNHNWPNDNL